MGGVERIRNKGLIGVSIGCQIQYLFLMDNYRVQVIHIAQVVEVSP